jgi:hypothetical protein
MDSKNLCKKGFFKRGLSQRVMNLMAGALGVALSFGSSAYAATASVLTMTGLTNNVDTTEYELSRILLLVLVLVGVMLILKGLVHLKQQYTSGGGGQEKHLSKGIASCIFGACMFMVIPIAHMFTNSVGGSDAPNWSISGSNTVTISADPVVYSGPSDRWGPGSCHGAIHNCP